ncbi:hypothetical protein [Nonomuraea typhae]|uniref:hypothetical protein n=1 Tax=Nonomuraea typhae TaxID=2603600 RepID=UPI0012FB57BC|nr:hypothetical protein [Nonomuraea typhae]
MQGWWANLLQGALSAIIGGVVAAVTAWGVVAATRRHDRRTLLEVEARNAAIELFVMLAEIDTKLTQALDNGVPLGIVTNSREWTVTVLKAEVAMFTLGRDPGRRFSQEIGDLRRALELAEGHELSREELLHSASTALQALADHLADWMMKGRHLGSSSARF